MLYMISQSGWEPVLIQQIVIGFEAIMESVITFLLGILSNFTIQIHFYVPLKFKSDVTPKLLIFINSYLDYFGINFQSMFYKQGISIIEYINVSMSCSF